MGRLADLAAAGHPAQGGPHEHGPQPGAAGAVPGPAGAGRGAGPAPAVPLYQAAGPVAERFFDTGALCALLDAHRAGKTNAMTKLWAFYCFIEWYEVYFTGKIPPDL